MAPRTLRSEIAWSNVTSRPPWCTASASKYRSVIWLWPWTREKSTRASSRRVMSSGQNWWSSAPQASLRRARTRCIGSPPARP